jgi:formate hydrogenlyase subunit 6/NADH:ubiquinone oxidoreductase subunit I
MVLSKEGFSKKSNIKMIRADEAGYNQPGLEGTGYDEPVVGCNTDPCNNEPKCVQFCPTGALIYGTIEEVREKKQQIMVLRKTNAEARVRAPWAQKRN